jgi:hypothetical protein
VNNVGVGAYAADLPSKGSVSAFIKGSIKEGGRAKFTSYPIEVAVGRLPVMASANDLDAYTEACKRAFDPRTGTWRTTTAYIPVYEDPTDLYETMTFSETTSVSGDITSFAKGMSYSSNFA